MKIEKIKKEIIDHVQKNIIASFSFLFLLFGGLIFFIYYLDIKYLPNLDLISSVQLLAVTSLTGILLVLSTLAILIFPGLFWQKYIFKNKTIANVWSNTCLRSIVIFIIPMFCVYFSLYVYIADHSEFKIIIKIINYQWTIKYQEIIIVNVVIISILCILGLLSYRIKKLGEKKFIIKYKVKQFTWKIFLFDYAKYMGLAYYGSFISILPTTLLILVFLNNYTGDIKKFSIGCLFLIVCIVISNSIAIGKPEDVNSVYWFFTVGLISFLCITVLTNTVSTFPKAIMRTYKLGNIEASSIIVDKQSCNTINKSMKLYNVKDPEKKNRLLHFSIENESCIIPDVLILSKLGTEAYIEFDNIIINIKGKEYENMRFTIPSSSIITYNLVW